MASLAVFSLVIDGGAFYAGSFCYSTAMGSLLSDLSTVMTAIFGQITKIATTIVNTPLLLFTVGFLFLGGCIGIFGRLLSRN